MKENKLLNKEFKVPLAIKIGKIFIIFLNEFWWVGTILIISI